MSIIALASNSTIRDWMFKFKHIIYPSVNPHSFATQLFVSLIHLENLANQSPCSFLATPPQPTTPMLPTKDPSVFNFTHPSSCLSYRILMTFLRVVILGEARQCWFSLAWFAISTAKHRLWLPFLKTMWFLLFQIIQTAKRNNILHGHLAGLDLSFCLPFKAIKSCKLIPPKPHSLH